jgi:hypothetical protein
MCNAPILRRDGVQEYSVYTSDCQQNTFCWQSLTPRAAVESRLDHPLKAAVTGDADDGVRPRPTRVTMACRMGQ